MYEYHINSLTYFLYHIQHSFVILKPAIKDNPFITTHKKKIIHRDDIEIYSNAYFLHSLKILFKENFV